MQKIRHNVFLSTVIIFLSSCTDITQISFFCEKDKIGNYIIKWEIFPDKEESAKIDVFSSGNDSVFPKNPIYTTPANEYIAVIPPKESHFREFFKLKLNKTCSGIITNRFFEGKNVQNLRDIGGYYTKDDKQVKWGKIYRSGDFSNSSPEDLKLIENLKIKTVVDFRRQSQTESHPDILPENINYIHIPIDVNYFNSEIRDKIMEGYFLKGDAIIYTQDCYRTIIEKHAGEYAKLFDILLDENNYPLLFHCGWGKDRSGLAAYFILKTLNVPTPMIEEDFLYSNQGIDKNMILENGADMPEAVQEAVTMITTADISQLRYAVSCMKKKSGSVDEYMNKELKLSPSKREKLKEMLLYK